MALMVTLWGVRLSYNFYRKGNISLCFGLIYKYLFILGGYSRGHEDYRWPAMREGFGWNAVTLQFFNFSFIGI